MSMFQRALALCVCAATLLLSASAAQASLTIGDPLLPREGAPYVPIEGSQRIEPLLRPDPAGGPPWAMTSFRATLDEPDAPPDLVLTCVAIGRFYHGQVGQIHVGGVFRPYGPGYYHACGGNLPDQQRGYLIGGVGRNAIEPASPCSPWPGTPLPDCDPANRRSIAFGIAGTGIRAGWAERDGVWQRMPVTWQGAYLEVWPGDVAARVKLRASLCGPFARPDMADNLGAEVDGCKITQVLPPPFPEGAGA